MSRNEGVVSDVEKGLTSPIETDHTFREGVDQANLVDLLAVHAAPLLIEAGDRPPYEKRAVAGWVMS